MRSRHAKYSPSLTGAKSQIGCAWYHKEQQVPSLLVREETVIIDTLCSAAVAPAPLHPDVIWLCSDEKVFTAACDVAGVSSEFLPMHSTPSKTYKYYVS